MHFAELIGSLERIEDGNKKEKIVFQLSFPKVLPAHQTTRWYTAGPVPNAYFVSAY
jgi:hypothetical protein